MTIYNVQPTYSTGISVAPWVVGEIQDMEPHNVVSQNVETAAGIGFGLAVSYGVNDDGCVVGGTKFLGITVRDVTLDYSLASGFTPDVYFQNTQAGILTHGVIAVQAMEACAPYDSVFFDATTGALYHVTGTGHTGQIAGARWITTTAQNAVGLIAIGIRP